MIPPLRNPVNALVSFHYFRERNLEDLARGGLRLIGDSGAFSAATTGATVDLDEFAGWATRWRDHLAWTASLDVIGDADASWRNYRRLRDHYGLDVVPTVHYPQPATSVDRYVDEGVDLIGLGGMVPYKTEADRLLRWTVAMFRYARDHHPDLRFHGWGVTHPILVKTLPWYSVDSSQWVRSVRFGQVVLYDPKADRAVKFLTDGRAVYRHGRLLRTVYGIEPCAVATSSSVNRPLHIHLAAMSTQLHEDHLARKFKVRAPKYGHGQAGRIGPSVHLVPGLALADLETLIDAIGDAP